MCVLVKPGFASYKTTVYDTPTAISLEKGEYNLESFFYGNGGMLFKFNVGINTHFNLGGMEYIDRLIGSERPIFSIPNVTARIRFTDQPLDSYNFAIGYDSLYNGTFHPTGKKLHGVYFVYTQGFMMLDAPQFFSVGVRQPLLYEIIQPDVFASIYFNLFEFFNLAVEINNLHFAKQYDYYFILNNVIIFKPFEELGIEFNLQMALTHNPDPNVKSEMMFSKEIRIFYQSFF